MMGKPETSVVAMGSDRIDIFRLADALNKKGWNLNNLQFPSWQVSLPPLALPLPSNDLT